MKKKQKILAITGVILLVLGTVFFAAFVLAGYAVSPGGGAEKVKIECNGVLAIGPFDGNKIEDLSCRQTACGILPFSLITKKGDVKLYVDGKYASSTSWKSTFGANQDFTLSSGCVMEPTRANVILYDEAGKVLDQKEVAIS